jgi:hypothetical protein
MRYFQSAVRWCIIVTWGGTMSFEDHAARQIISVFAKYKVPVGGVLKRHQFFEVRDSDFQRGIDMAVSSGWIQRHHRDRYQYILTAKGRDACRAALMPTTVPVSLAEVVRLRP